jgi:hypothetical protein
VASWSRRFNSSLNSRGLATLAPMGKLRVTADLYINDIRASMSVKKEAGADSPLARRYAFVGHLREAKNTAAVIGSFVSMGAPIIPKVRPTVPTVARADVAKSVTIFRCYPMLSSRILLQSLTAAIGL